MNNADIIYDGGSIVLEGGSNNPPNVVIDVNLANSFFYYTSEELIMVSTWKTVAPKHGRPKNQPPEKLPPEKLLPENPANKPKKLKRKDFRQQLALWLAHTR